MGRVEQFNSKIAAITVSQPMNGDVHVYVIRKEKVTLIDCGHPSPESLDELFSGLDQLGLKPENIDQILLTHRHIDHVGALVCERAYFGHANVVASYGSLEPIVHLDELDRMKRHIPEQHVAEVIDEAFLQAYRTYYSYYRPLRIDRMVREGDRIDIGDGQHLLVLETPGHSRDHISLLHAESGTLFGGDILLHNGPPLIQCLDSYRKSMEKINSSGADVVLPGHGKEIHNVNETVAQTTDRLTATDQKIIEAWNRNVRTPYELALEITGGRVHRGLRFFIGVVLTHLDELKRNHQI
ncbi:MBL fold metallo-hydrolase [Paenibacillus mesophilus]|uniref:MBL fold metallo-hydrolase n=1 Tax=Paenibacillus mesophilus TaxID=2582849 RepID=UPI00110DD16C|nr:MBL fold metallo-hydrolase [Paenibacillus mesophilus]TMV50090.1 MBL fold metallo-hydrolase [Paenibacillus mesophilus]